MESQKKNLLNLAAEHSIFRVLFGIRFEVIITMIVQSTIFSYPPPNAVPWRAGKKKKKNEPRSRKQSTEYSELSFELGSRLSLQ